MTTKALLKKKTSSFNFKLFKDGVKKEYKKIGKIYCPCLDETVSFTSVGFHHLSYSAGRARNKKEAQYKLSVFQSSRTVIQKATGIDEVRNKILTIKGKEKEVQDYSLVHIIYSKYHNKNIKVKVILRRIGDGKLIFLSVMHK